MSGIGHLTWLSIFPCIWVELLTLVYAKSEGLSNFSLRGQQAKSHLSGDIVDGDNTPSFSHNSFRKLNQPSTHFPLENKICCFLKPLLPCLHCSLLWTDSLKLPL